MVGEVAGCEDPWFTGLDLTGFLATLPPGSEDPTPYATCAFYRFFEKPEVYNIKLGEDIKFQAGFKFYNTTNNPIPVQ